MSLARFKAWSACVIIDISSHRTF